MFEISAGIWLREIAVWAKRASRAGDTLIMGIVIDSGTVPVGVQDVFDPTLTAIRS